MLKDAKENSTLLGRPQEAYKACLPEMERLQSAQIQAVNLDVMETLRTSLRAAAEGALNDFDLS